MAHGTRTRAISGELISGSMSDPVTSSEQVWDYSQTDSQNKPRTQEAINAEALGKQDRLVSGTNIKTINNNSLLGSGNITISSGGGAGTLNTTTSNTLAVQSSESLGSSVSLHRVSKTGKYDDLIMDRTYSSGGGMGRKLLKTDTSLSNQMTQTNTVYIFRDVFDLNGESVTVPANSVLKFEGGSIKNTSETTSTITLGKNVVIDAPDVKIFYTYKTAGSNHKNLKFAGEVSEQFYKLEWFVENYSEAIELSNNDVVLANYPDATNEIQSMFDSGLKKIWLANRHYYRISATIIIPSDVIIDGDAQRDFPSGDTLDSRCNYIWGRIDSQPLVSIKASSGSTEGVTVRNLYLYRYEEGSVVTAQNEYKKNISTLYVDCTEGSIWGLNIDAVIAVNRVQNTVTAADGVTTANLNFGGYTAIEINASGDNYCTFIYLAGYIRNFWRALNVHFSSGAWITGVGVEFDTAFCTYGGYIQGYNSVDCTVIKGNHQAMHSISKNEDAYFTIDRGICKAEAACFFDIQSDNGVDYAANAFSGVKYSVSSPRFEGVNNNSGVISGIAGVEPRKYDMTGKLSGKAVMASNRLPMVFYGVDYQKYANNIGTIGGVYTPTAFGNTVENVVYEITDRDDTVVALTEGNTFGYHDLFYPDKLNVDYMTGDVLAKNSQHFSYYNVLEDVEEYGEIVKKPVPVKAAHVGFDVLYSDRETLIVNCASARVTGLIIKITDVASGDVLEEKSCGTSFYYNTPVYYNLPYRSSKIHVDVDITYNQSMRYLNLPFVGLCGSSVGELIGSWGGYTVGPLLSREFLVQNPNTDLVKYVGHHNLNYDWNRHSFDDGGSTQVPYLAFHQTSGYPVALTILGSTSTIRLNLVYNGSTMSCTAIVNGTYKKGMVNVRWTGTSSTCYVVVTCGNQYRAYIENLATMSGVRIHKIEKSSGNYLVDGEILDLTGFNTVEPLIRSNITIGASNARPDNVETGHSCYDTTFNLPCWWNGTKWIENDGANIGVKRSGGDGERPTSDKIYIGFRFFNTTTNSDNIYAGSNKWVDSQGNNVTAKKVGLITQRPALIDVVTGFGYVVTQEFTATVGGASVTCSTGVYTYITAITSWAAPNGTIIADSDLPARS